MEAQALVLLPIVAIRGLQLLALSPVAGTGFLFLSACLAVSTENAFHAFLLALLGTNGNALTSQCAIQTIFAWLAGSRAWPLVVMAPLLLDLRQSIGLYLLTASCLSSAALLRFQSLPQPDVTLLLQSAFLCWSSLAREGEEASGYPTANYSALAEALFLSAACLVISLSLAIRSTRSRRAREILLSAGFLLAATVTLSAPYVTPAGAAGGNLFAFTLDRLLHHKRLVAYQLGIVPVSLYFGLTKALRAPQGPHCELSIMAAADKKPYVLGRKFFHCMTALIALPQALSDPHFMSAAWAVCLLAYAFAEAIRIVDFAGAAKPINALILPLTDERDRDGLILTPFFLGLGTCVTLWMETFRRDGCFSPYRASIGLVATCIGDAAAGLAGTFSPVKWRLYGSKINGKTIQGTAAFIVSYVVFSVAEVAALSRWGEREVSEVLPAIVAAAVVSGLVEGYTTSIDNFIVALVAYLTHRTFCAD